MGIFLETLFWAMIMYDNECETKEMELQLRKCISLNVDTSTLLNCPSRCFSLSPQVLSCYNYRYDEGCKYNFKTPPSDKYSYRHFTQMTWQGSRSLGVGISYGKVNNLQCLYYVARYRPRGNLGNALLYAHNVRKGAFDSSFCKPVPSQPQEAVLKN